MEKYRIAVIPGDGIGPEVIAEGMKLLRAIEINEKNIHFELSEFLWGSNYYHRNGRMMPEDGLDQLSSYDAILLGAVGDPSIPDHITLRELLLKIRKEFDEYINLRPVKLLKGAYCPIKNAEKIDMTFVRENSEGEYSGSGAWLYKDTPNEVVIQNGVFSRMGCERVMRYAFDLARKEKKSLTSVSKGNALNYSMVFWDQIFRELSIEYPDVETHTVLVDAASMFMIKNPERFEIVVASNLFGDILTDLGAAIAGGMGLAAGANLNPERKYPSMFEPIHGSAPDIAGKGVANPMAVFWSVAQMMEFFGHKEWSDRIINCMEEMLVAQSILTPDLGGDSSTSQVGDEMIRRIQLK